jgi:hypothetical protein
VGNSDYLDDGTVVYEWGGYSGRSWFQDIYRLKLGSTKSNLTGDTSAWCSLGGAR